MDQAAASDIQRVDRAHALYVGLVLESVDHARQFVNEYAIFHNFAVKKGVVKNKDNTLLLLCKCARKPFNTRNLPLAKGSTGDNGLIRQQDARSMLCDCPWRVRWKRQWNDTWIITELVDQHERHQLEGINPAAYSENRPLPAEARETMLDHVQHSTVSYRTVASVLNSTYGLSLLSRDVYNRSYDYTQNKGTSTRKLIETLRDDGFLYRLKVDVQNSIEALFFCKPQDVQMARIYGQMVIIDATYKTNRFRLPLVNIVTVDNNLHTVRTALCFVSSEKTSAYTWILQQLSETN
jgi:hypothetical protein